MTEPTCKRCGKTGVHTCSLKEPMITPEIVYKINGKFQTKFPKKEIRLGHEKIETYISLSSLRAWIKENEGDDFKIGRYIRSYELLQWLQQEDDQ